MNTRLTALAMAALVVFAAMTVVERVSISHGGRESAWMARPFGAWPATIDEVQGSGHLQFSIVASYDPAEVTANAAPPQGIPALLGRVGTGSVVDSFDSGHINGSRFTTGIVAGPVSSISAFVAAPVDVAPHDQYQLAIYGDSRGAPSRLLAATDSGTLTPGAWNTLPISAILEPTTAYWLMYSTNGSNGAVNNLTYTPLSGSALDNAIRSHMSASLVRGADHLTAVGNLTLTLVAVAALALLIARHRFRSGVALMLGFAAAMTVAWILRETVFQPYGRYPSGHALRLTVAATGLAYLVPRRSVRVCGWLVVLLVSVAAVYSGRHYSEEMIGGVLLGWSIATGALALAVGRPRDGVTEPAPRASADPIRVGTLSNLSRSAHVSSSIGSISLKRDQSASFRGRRGRRHHR